MKKYFFFDLDGTLSYGRERFVPASARECIEALRRNGHFVSIATGRLQSDAASFAQRFGIDSLVADGGCSLTVGGALLYMKGLPRAECVALIERLNAAGIAWAACVCNDLVLHTIDERYEKTAGKSYFKVFVQPDFDIYGQTVFYKLFAACTAEREGRVNFGSLPAVQYGENCILIEPVDKAAGIRHMMRYLAAPCEQVVVFGDGLNDLKMFDPAWFSIAMGNSCTALKQRADFITDSCDQDGVWKACRHFGWI